MKPVMKPVVTGIIIPRTTGASMPIIISIIILVGILVVKPVVTGIIIPRTTGTYL